MKGIATVQT